MRALHDGHGGDDEPSAVSHTLIDVTRVILARTMLIARLLMKLHQQVTAK